jgi:hypothetical protein
MHKLTNVTSIIASIFGVGALLAGLILTGQHGIKGEINGTRGEIHVMKVNIADLRQRIARIEGQLSLLLEAWDSDKPGSPAVAGK